jgi:arsenate reductase
MHVHMSPLMRQCLAATTQELSEEFRGVFSRETVARCVVESFERIGDRPTVGPNFLPVIIERFARERLWAVAQSDGQVEKPLPEVLFVCERNAGRSQMAAALAHSLSNGWVGVRSAGSHPDEQIDPVVAQAMMELGVDVACEFPKPLTDEVVRAADVVVTPGVRGRVCGVSGQALSGLAGRRSCRPAIEVVRRIRYERYHRVWDLLETLVPCGILIDIHRPIGGQR